MRPAVNDAGQFIESFSIPIWRMLNSQIVYPDLRGLHAPAKIDYTG